MSKVRDISNLSNVIRTDASGNVSFVSGSTTLATLNTSGQLSGSSPVLSSSYASTSSYATNFNVSGTITATTLVVQTVTSSVIYSSGSNVFGNSQANTQTFTGSVLITGSLNIINSGSLFVSTSGFIGMNTTQSGNSTLTIAPLRTPGVAFQVIADKDGRTTSFYTSDFVNATAGSSLRMGFLTGSGNTSASIQAYNTGENTYGSLLLNSGGGNVGINTTNPATKFHVLGAIRSQDSRGGSLAAVEIYGGDSSYNPYISVDQSNPLTIITGAAERMRIASNGLVSINNTVASSNYKLGVSGSAYINGSNGKGIFVTDGASYASIVGLNSAISAYNNLELRASGTDYQLYLNTSGNVGIGTVPSYGFHVIKGQFFLQPQTGNSGYTTDGLWGSTATPSFIGATGQAGSSAKYGASGILLGYQDTGNGLYSPAYGFEVKSTDGRPVTGIVVKAIVMKDTDTGTLVFYINNNGNVLNANNSYGSTSDVSIKENIVDATPKLSNLMNVKIRNYNLKADPIKIKQIGVVAQELEEVFPGMVETDTEGLKSVKYSVFVPMLVKAIQELNQKFEDYKSTHP